MEGEAFVKYIESDIVPEVEADKQDTLDAERDKFKAILAGLVCIEMVAKNLHYNAKDKEFYGVHLLADLIGDVQSERDKINEVCYLGFGATPPLMEEVYLMAALNLKDKEIKFFEDDKMISALGGYCDRIIMLIEERKKADPEMVAGVQAVLDEISQKLLTSRGLLRRTQESNEHDGAKV